MITTVADLKKFLDQFPNDTEVEFVIKESGRGWDGDTVISVPADLSDYGNWYFTDSNTDGRKILTLGED